MDDLVKRLRDAAKMSEALAVLLHHSEGNATAKLYKEAADAIEKLQQYAELYKDGGEAVKKAAETYKAAYIAEHDARVAELPRWIPATERLPEKNGPYLCCWKASADEKMHIARIMIWRADTGWMNAWDEPMSNYVTHWMPLPSTEGLNET